MTTRDDILRMAREAGFITGTRDYADGDGAMPFVQSVATGTFLPELERFHALATERERAARQAAQTENEELKARLARAGVEQRRAVRDERKACLEIADQCADSDMHASMVANCIRAREGLDAPNLRPKGTYTLNCPTVLRSGQQTPTLDTAPGAQDTPIFTWCELVKNNLSTGHLSGVELINYIERMRADINRTIRLVREPSPDMTEALALLSEAEALALTTNNQHPTP